MIDRLRRWLARTGIQQGFESLTLGISPDIDRLIREREERQKQAHTYTSIDNRKNPT